MLDIKFIEENKEEVKRAVKVKGLDVDIDLLLELNDKRKNLLKEIEDLRAKRNQNVENVKKEDVSKRNEFIEEGKKLKKN